MSADPQEEFAQLLIEIIKSRRSDWNFVYDSEDFTIEALDRQGTRQAFVRLDNLYAKYLSSASDEKRLSVLSDFSNLIVSSGTPETFDEAKPSVVPLIKDRWYVEVLNVTERLSMNKGKSDGDMILSSYNLVEEISVILSFEMPEVRSLITNGKLKAWNLSFVEAMNHALETLKNRTAATCQAHFLESETEPYAFSSAWKDSFDASRILIDDVRDSFPVKGDVIIAMPHAGELLVTGTEEAHGLKLVLSRFFQAFEKETRYLPPLPLLWKDGVLDYYTVPDNHPTAAGFQTVQRLWLQDIYEQQRKMFAGEWASLTDGMHVAQYELLEKETKGMKVMISNCTVTDMNPVLIPETDLITFCELDEDGLHMRAVGTWEEAVAILGDDLAPLSYYPRLYRVGRFPTGAELASMRRTQ